MPDLFNQLNALFSGTDRRRIHLAGGIVRDQLLTLDGSDIDLVSSLPPDDFAALGFRLVTGKSTAPIWFLHSPPFGAIEVTLISDPNHLEADLSRRDFTINAMAMTLDGDLVDPLHGRDDLSHHRLRACSVNCFRDDPIRLFRAFRFAGDGWRMTDNTAALIREESWSDRLGTIPIERFSREMLKALQTAFPERFFQLMQEYKVGSNYLPEIFRMPRVPAGPRVYHPEGDLFTHSCQVLQRVVPRSGDALPRFCAFFHDIGKLATPADLFPKHHGHEQAGFHMALDFCRRLRLPASYGTALSWVSRLHGKLYNWGDLRDSTKLETAEQALKAGIAEVLPLVAAADKALGSEPDGWRTAIEIAGRSATDLDIDPLQLEQLPQTQRTDSIRQKRVELFRSTQTSST